MTGQPARDMTGEPARDMTGQPAQDMTGQPAQDMTGQPAQDMTGQPGDMSMPPTLAAACDLYASAFCARLSSCSMFLIQRQYGDTATCQNRVSASCLLQRRAPGSGFGIPQLTTCAGAIARSACGAFLDPAGIAACNPVPGALANGKVCGDDSQCHSALCQRGNGATGCGTCAKGGAAGEPCSNTAPCSFGLFCVGSGASRKCAPAAGLGEACQGGIVVSADPPCNVELYCSNGKCAAQLGPGAPCHAIGVGGAAVECDAEQGLYCDVNAAAPTCVAYVLAAAGAACGQVDSGQIVCKASGSCVGNGHNNKCAAAIMDGAMCGLSIAASCMTPAACTGGTCAIFDPSGC